METSSTTCYSNPPIIGCLYKQNPELFVGELRQRILRAIESHNRYINSITSRNPSHTIRQNSRRTMYAKLENNKFLYQLDPSKYVGEERERIKRAIYSHRRRNNTNVIQIVTVKAPTKIEQMPVVTYLKLQEDYNIMTHKLFKAGIENENLKSQIQKLQRQMHANNSH